MLVAERDKLFLVHAVSELKSVILQDGLEELENGVWCFELVQDHAMQVRWNHDCVALRLPEKLSLLVELVSHLVFTAF